jgi:RNA polymerase sigma factor (sigma-70 family)
VVWLKACAKDGIEVIRRGSPEQKKAWLATTMGQTMTDLVRHYTCKKRDVRRECPLGAVEPGELPGSDDLSPAAEAEQAEQHERLNQELRKLRHRQGDAVELRFLKDMTYNDVAQRLCCTRQAAWEMIQRGVSQMAKGMKPD